MSKRSMILAAGALVIVAGGLGAYFLMSGGGDESGPEAAPETVGIIDLEPFLTNVGDKRHARVQIKLTVSPQERAEELLSDPLALARLRDQILSSLAAKSVAELTTPEGKAALRKQILADAAPLVQPGALKEALFAEFVIQ